MGSILSTQHTTSDVYRSVPNNAHPSPQPSESRIVVVAKRANSTSNINNTGSSATITSNKVSIVLNSESILNDDDDESATTTIDQSEGLKSSISIGGVGKSASFSAPNSHHNIGNNNNNNINNTTTNSHTISNVVHDHNPSIAQSVVDNGKFQSHDDSSLLSIIRFNNNGSDITIRNPSPDSASNYYYSSHDSHGPKSNEQLSNQSNTNLNTIASPFSSFSTSSGLNNQVTSNSNYSHSTTVHSTPLHLESSPTLLPFPNDHYQLSNSSSNFDHVSTPNRYRRIQQPVNAFTAFNRRASLSNPIVPVAIVENNNSGSTNSLEPTNSFSSLSQWGGINEETILPETQQMNDYNNELRKQVKSTLCPEDLTRLEIGTDDHKSDILIQTLLYNPIATIITDLDGNVITMNEPFKQMFRVEEPSSNITNISVFIPKEHRKYHEKVLKKNKKIRPKIKRVTLGLTQYGDKIPISITITSSTLQTSGKHVYICFIKDLTSEFKLNTLDTMYQNVTGLSSIPIVGIDQDCKITLFNQAAEETWMISKTEVIENNVKILMPSAIAKVHDRIVGDYILGRRERALIDKVKQVTGRRVGNGKEFPLEIKVAEVKHELNNKRSFVAFLRDLTAVMTAREFQLTLYPEKVVNMLQSGEGTIHHQHTCASVLFCDIVGFTEISRQMESSELVMMLDEIISMFDNNLLSKFRIEKIKTMGDNYMCATGLDDNPDHANNIVGAALEMQKLMHEFNEKHEDLRQRFHCNEFGQVISVRVGVNSGELVAGIVGNRKPVYDVFGGNVNLASRMESSGIESQVQITSKTYSLLRDELKQLFTLRKDNKVKGIGLMDTYITNLKPNSFNNSKNM